MGSHFHGGHLQRCMRLHAGMQLCMRVSARLAYGRHRTFKPNLDLSVGLTNRKGLLQGLPIDRLNASGQFVLPAMPGTGHATALDDPFGEGTALVGTHPVECVEHARSSK